MQINPSLERYVYGNTVQLMAVPDDGYYLKNWANAVTGDVSPMEYKVEAPNPTVMAFFIPATGKATLTLLVDGPGKVEVAPQKAVYSVGETVSLKAVPNSSAKFVGYSGGVEGTQTSTTLTLDANKKVTAKFEGDWGDEVPEAKDTEAPVLTLSGEMQVTIGQGSTYVDAGASATDNVDGDLTAEIVVSGEVDAANTGTYTLSYDVSDTAGNAAESVSRSVLVEKPTGGTVVAKPVITSQESEAVGTAGETLVLAVGVSGKDVTYQWSKDGTDIAGATSATLELSGLSAAKAGNYVLKVINGGGSVESSPIAVSVQTFVIRLNGKASGSTASVVDKASVQIESGKTGWFTYYTLDGSDPENGLEYEVPFELTSNAVIRAIAYPSDFSDEVVGPRVDLTVLKSQTLTVEVPQGVAYGAVTLIGSASSGLPVSYEVIDGPGKVVSGIFEGTGSGVVTLKAKQVGDGTYASVEKSFEVLVNKGVQTVSWGTVTAKTYGDAPFDVSATASSGLALSYEVVSGPATIDGTKATLSGAGKVVLKAIQFGNDNLEAATALTSIDVGKAKQTVSFTSLYGTKAFTSAPIKLEGTVSSGLSVVYEVLQGEAEVFGDELTLTGVGPVTVRAKQLGNDDYEAASAVDRTFTVSQASQSVEIVVGDQMEWQSEPVQVGLKSSSGFEGV